jgi:hypothetical protein
MVQSGEQSTYVGRLIYYNLTLNTMAACLWFRFIFSLFIYFCCEKQGYMSLNKMLSAMMQPPTYSDILSTICYSAHCSRLRFFSSPYSVPKRLLHIQKAHASALLTVARHVFTQICREISALSIRYS